MNLSVRFDRVPARVRGDGEGAGGHGEADDQGQGGRGAERVAGFVLPEVSRNSETSCHFVVGQSCQKSDGLSDSATNVTNRVSQ